MARGEPTPAKALLPALLISLARKTGNATALRPLWEQAVGPVISRVSRPHLLRGSTLTVLVEGDSWARELEGQASELLNRLRLHLPQLGAQHLSFVTHHDEDPR